MTVHKGIVCCRLVAVISQKKGNSDQKIKDPSRVAAADNSHVCGKDFGLCDVVFPSVQRL